MARGTKKTGRNVKGEENIEHSDYNSEDVDYPAILRANKDKIARNREGGKHSVRDAQADFEASMRGAHHRNLQTSIESMEKFELQKTANFPLFSEVLKQRFKYSRKVRSIDLPRKKDDAPLESSSVVTPPDCVDLYHLIEIMDGELSVLQLVFKQCNGYYQGFRPTPKVRYAKDGFFVFSDVRLPAFFGTCHWLSRTADYLFGDQVLIGEGFLGIMVDQMVEVTIKNYKNLLGYIIETPMIAFGEAERLHIIEAFFGEKFEAELDTLTLELCFYYGNWSYLSKLALHIYLAIVEVLVMFHGSHASVRNAWGRLRRAIKQFQRKGFELALNNEDGYFCLSRLIGSSGLLRLLKCESDVVRKIIIRLHQRSMAEFKETRADSKGSCSTSSPSDSDSDTEDEGDDYNDQEAGEPAGEQDADEFVTRLFNEMADREHSRWSKIVEDGRDLLDELMRCPKEMNCSHCHR